MIATVIGTLVSSTAHAAPAPIRYGHGQGAEQTSSASYKQYASVANTSYAASAGSKTDRFFYPDEIVPGLGFPQQAKPVQTASIADSFALSNISADDYYSYAKIGTPYTVNGVTYFPKEDPNYDRRGTASWYGSDFHGKLTANGETYDMMSLSAAHPTLPLPCYVLVTNETNGRQIVVRVNDRGPFKKNRVIDLSKAAAQKLDMIGEGTAEVRVQYLGRAEKAGDAPLMKQQVIAPIQVADIAQPAPEKKNTRKAFVPADTHFVQLGSFASRSNANDLLRQASAVSSEGDVVFVNVNGAKRYRVVLGPYASKDDADQMLSKMTRSGFEGLIVKNPT